MNQILQSEKTRHQVLLLFSRVRQIGRYDPVYSQIYAAQRVQDEVGVEEAKVFGFQAQDGSLVTGPRVEQPG